ncbi:MAG: sensor histidine kinase [Chitinophagaceae bacterium]|nr:sensor histidine kinase [Chitinophagaceae bacterium]
MRRLLLLIWFFLFLFPLAAQVNVDSLHAVVQSKKPYQEQIKASLKLMENYQLKNFDSTLSEGERALKMARRNTDSVSVAEIKRHVGVASYFKGNYDVAAANFIEAIAILEKSNQPAKLAPVYNELAKLYRKTRDLDRALLTYNKADAIYRQLRDTAGISMILNESGVVFEYRADYAEAINRYAASLELARKRGDSLGVSYSLSNLAGVYVIQQKFALAEENLLRALHIREQLRDSFAIALTYSDLGVAMNHKGDYGKAVLYLGLSNEMAEKLKYPELQSNNYNELSAVAQKQGDFQNAFRYFLKRSALRDSLYALEKAKQIEELNTRYETARREKEIQQQKSKIRIQRLLIAGIAVLAILAALLLWSAYRRRQLRQETAMKTELMKQQELAIRAVMEAEENERERIARDLHDGVGQMMSAAKMNLSAFESELPFADAEQRNTFEKIIRLVDESCREVRTVSHIMMPNALLKNNLGDAIREFTGKLNQKDLRIHVYTEGLDQRLDSGMETMLYRVVQECVNNTIKHAGAATLDISLIRDTDGISGTIEDNGKGFDASDPAIRKGIGIRNISSRIEYLKGTVDFDSAPGRGTVVAFHIPLNEPNS